MSDKPLAIVDIETTGGSPTGDRVLEIAIIRLENGRREVFQTLIDPETRIPPWISSITGITEEDIRTAPTFNDVREKVQDMLKDAIFVAHNARFDYGFIKNEFKRHGMSWRSDMLCTVKLSRVLFPSHRKHDLSSLIRRHKLECADRHRAYGDAFAVEQFLKIAASQLSHDAYTSAVNKIVKHDSIPTLIDPQTIRNLPEGPGVYIFYGEHGEVLYVGKSVNIKNRVRSHFTGDHASTKEMNLCQQVADVEARQTAGELGALLLESELIKTQMPLYNRVSRISKRLVFVQEVLSTESYSTAIIEELTEAPADLESVIGIFKSVKKAKEFLEDAAKNHTLCPKLLNLEGKTKGASACFYHQLEKCNGACVGKEASEAYNARFAAAFAERRVQKWPFEGPVAIEERSSETERELFIVNKWILTKAVSQEDETEREFIGGKHSFDFDAYRILSSYFKRNPHKIQRVSGLNVSETEAIC